jgi:hypothetical protein
MAGNMAIGVQELQFQNRIGFQRLASKIRSEGRWSCVLGDANFGLATLVTPCLRRETPRNVSAPVPWKVRRSQQ